MLSRSGRPDSRRHCFASWSSLYVGLWRKEMNFQGERSQKPFIFFPKSASFLRHLFQDVMSSKWSGSIMLYFVFWSGCILQRLDRQSRRLDMLLLNGLPARIAADCMDAATWSEQDTMLTSRCWAEILSKTGVSSYECQIDFDNGIVCNTFDTMLYRGYLANNTQQSN